MKKWIVMILSCLLVLPLSVFATSSYVVDEAGLLNEHQIADLENSSREFYADSGMELVFLTVDSLDDKSAMAYADDYFDTNYGENGILLLIAMNEREWYISTCGTAIEAFTDSDLMGMEEDLMKYLPDGEYYKAFLNFFYDCQYYWCNEEPSDLEAGLFVGIPAGFIIALVVLLILRATMNTKKSQPSAVNYEVKGSYNLRRHQDLFLYSKVRKQVKPKDNNNSGGGSHSTTHVSSSGRSHGGRGGKF